MHYSGVWDSDYVRRHPEHALITADGTVSDRITSLHGPYVDRLLIPQLMELRDEYDVDGVWIDGECWAVEPDFGEAAVAAFRKETGIRDIPRSPADHGYPEYVQFTRRAFRRYLQHYVEALHRHDPEYQITSNWAYSSQMPEPADIAVDYISGDYSLQDSINSARFEGRCMQHQGKPWDLMAWSFSGRFEERTWTTKSVVQLKQEAAAVLALGGGFQAYFQQKRDGSVALWQMKIMAEVAAFCRERQQWCHRAQPVPQIALLYSGYAMYRGCTKPFGGWDVPALTALKGVLRMLLESQCVVEICMEHHLRGRMDAYPLIVVPEWAELEPGIRDDLASYAHGGGSLLLVGPAAGAMFEAELDIELHGDRDGTVVRWLEHQGHLGVVRSHFQRATLGPRARPFGRYYSENDVDPAGTAGPGADAAVIATYGSGTMAATLLGMGEPYLHGATTTLRGFLGALVDALFVDPMVRVTASSGVDVTLMRANGALCVNLLNTTGPHSDPDVYVFDEIPPVGPVTVRVRMADAPQTVTLEPGGRDVEWRHAEGEVVATLDRLEIHDILAIRE